MTKPTTNTLLDKTVTALYKSLTGGAKIGKPKFEIEDFGRALATIYELNALPADTKSYQGTLLKDWDIPEAFKSMLFPEISLTGAANEVPLVTWNNASKYDAFNEAEMMEFSRRLYATFRNPSKTVNVYDVLGVKQSISSFISNIALDEERVTDSFERGKFPIYVTVDFFKDYAEGIKVTKAHELFVDSMINALQ